MLWVVHKQWSNVICETKIFVLWFAWLINPSVKYLHRQSLCKQLCSCRCPYMISSVSTSTYSHCGSFQNLHPTRNESKEMTLSFYINNIQENESSSLKPDKSVLLSEQNKKECDLVYSEIFCFFLCQNTRVNVKGKSVKIIIRSNKFAWTNTSPPKKKKNAVQHIK